MAQKTICQISAAVPALDGQSNSLAAEPIAVRKDSGFPSATWKINTRTDL
jgi:hypothetical protein